MALEKITTHVFEDKENKVIYVSHKATPFDLAIASANKSEGYVIKSIRQKPRKKAKRTTLKQDEYKKLLNEEQWKEFVSIKGDKGFIVAAQWANGQLKEDE